jgi:hypothetical protein
MVKVGDGLPPWSAPLAARVPLMWRPFAGNMRGQGVYNEIVSMPRRRSDGGFNRLTARVPLSLVDTSRRVSKEKAKRYSYLLMYGAAFPPVKLFWCAACPGKTLAGGKRRPAHDSGMFHISDGGHRTAAHRRIGAAYIPARFSIRAVPDSACLVPVTDDFTAGPRASEESPPDGRDWTSRAGTSGFVQNRYFTPTSLLPGR